MYKRESGGWLKHYDFLLLDMICLQIAFLLSFVVLGRGFNPYIVPEDGAVFRISRCGGCLFL